MSQVFDRATQDVGNIVALEHVNLLVSDQSKAHLFYVSGMGFTRDPYIDFGMRNMWINLGRQQFHLPVGEPQVLRGVTGIVVPSLAELEARLAHVAPLLEDSQIAWSRHNGHLRVTCPWGNTLEVSESDPASTMPLGMPYVRFDVPAGTAEGIVRFYQQVMDAPASLVQGNEGTLARVQVGGDQSIEYRESSEPLPAYDGHHIAVYVSDFSGPHRRLLERGLVSEESDASQYRFQIIADPESGEALFEIEHEVRSMVHPMWGRYLVNRNPNMNNRNFRRGHEVFPN